jgi:hypothetical protein
MTAVAMIATSALHLPENFDEPEEADWAVALVISELVRVVDEDRASMRQLESGAIEFRLLTGEVFHLDDETITRVA